MHLGNRGGRDRRPKARKGLFDRTFQRGRNCCLRFALREWRQSILQRLEIARQHHADHIGPGRKKLAKLQIGRAHPFQRARQPRP